jgi:hypothetical protein
MFHVIEFENIESEETQNLMFSLSGIPNGTIISFSRRILTMDDKWVVWIEKDIIDKFNTLYYSFSKTKGIHRFFPLYITDSIHDPDWKWEDEYIRDILDNFIYTE